MDPQHDGQETQTWVVGATCIGSRAERLPDGGGHGAAGAAPCGEVPHTGSNGLSVARGPSPEQTVQRHPAEGGGGGLPPASTAGIPPGVALQTPSPPRPGAGAQRPQQTLWLSGFALCTQVGAVSARFRLPSCGAELLTVTSLWK